MQLQETNQSRRLGRPLQYAGKRRLDPGLAGYADAFGFPVDFGKKGFREVDVHPLNFPRRAARLGKVHELRNVFAAARRVVALKKLPPSEGRAHLSIKRDRVLKSSIPPRLRSHCTVRRYVVDPILHGRFF